jgi:hypothetical protein
MLNNLDAEFSIKKIPVELFEWVNTNKQSTGSPVSSFFGMTLLYNIFFRNSKCVIKKEKLIVCFENLFVNDGFIFLKLFVSLL